ncbi:transposable element Tcb2 transposase [Trichonephila clavipes]|uniref:Transposable element Tcb2 transposase n=1 Tax=Trichonephila clavipes TaxID=2585209 RepID=A0A8X6SHA9_TRICX|nr:transposable element Tcb2 transposase [Trichonephila clavipes]
MVNASILPFALQRPTAPTAGVMIWGAIVYNTRSPFSTRQCSDSHGKGVTTLSPHCYYPSWPTRSPDLSPIEHIWDHLGRQVGHPTILNELEARLQQIWNEMSQDIIQNLYASMPSNILFPCLCAKV